MSRFSDRVLMIKKIAVSLCAYVVAFPAYAQENIRGIYSDQIDEIFSQKYLGFWETPLQE